MSRIKQWVMAATLICGANAFTACTSDNGDNPSDQGKKNRAEFVAHTRANLKTLAENLNFSSWTGINNLNNDFNTNVLNNPAFDKTISTLFRQEVRNTIKPVEEGSELAQLGYQMYAVIDLTAFNYRFTINDEGTAFDVEPAEDFMLFFKRTPHEPGDGMGPEGEERPKGPEGEERPEGPEGGPKGEPYECLILKASGSSVDMLGTQISTDELAVIIRIPTAFDFIIGMLREDETIQARLTGTFKNEFASRGTSSFIDMRTDAWNITGKLESNIDVPGGGEGPQGPGAPGSGPKADATTLTFAIGQDPATHEAGLQLGFIHNEVDMIKLRGVMKSLNGQTDYTQFTNATSISEIFAAIMAGNSIEDATFTILDDLTTTLKVSDCAEVLNLQSQMARARRSYADEATIEKYTQQLNQLVSARMTCKGVNQVIPMQLKTTKFGVDYWAMPALNFADENGYVAITDMLDPESIQYMINIADHAAEPMQQSVVTVRQLVQYLRTFMGDVQSQQQE